MSEEKKNFINAMMIYLKSINAPENQWLHYSCHVKLGEDDLIKCTNECLTVGIPEAPFNKWISVKDRLPEFDKEILIYDDAIYIGHLTDYSMVDDENPYQWSTHWGRLNPTHWMELPHEPTE